MLRYKTDAEKRAAAAERQRKCRAKQTREKADAVRAQNAACQRNRLQHMTAEERAAFDKQHHAADKRLYDAKRYGAAAFCADRAAAFAEGSKQRLRFEALADDGFFILRGCALPANWQQLSKSVMAKSKGQSLFSHATKTGILRHNAKRKMWLLHDEFKSSVVNWVSELLEQELALYTIVDPCIIHNNRVDKQPAHRDIRNQSHLWREFAPLAGIIALQDNTSILVKRNSLEQTGSRELERVQLSAGDVFIMHGLLVHAGDAYTASNLRMHFVALSEGLKSKPIDETFVVSYS